MSDYTGSSFISAPVESELTELETLINDNSNDISTNATNLAQEIINRETADTGLQTQINDRALQSALTAEASTRLLADEALSTRITNNSISIGTNATNLAQEITDRGAADTGLQNQINDRALTLSLNNEITARTAADDALGGRIDFEKSTTSYYIQGLQGQIDVNRTAITAEETARQSADSTLQASITTNATAIGTKANDIDVVKLTGTQTIGGEKTFTNDTYMSSDLILADDEGKIILGTNYDRKIYRTADGIRTDDTMDASQYLVSGTQIASTDLGDVTTLVKTSGDQSIGGIKTYTDDQIVDNIIVNTAIKSAQNAGLEFGVNSGGVPITAMRLLSDATTEMEGNTSFKQGIIGHLSQSLTAGTRLIDNVRLITKLDTRAGNIVCTISNGIADGQIKIISLHRADPQYTATLLTNVSEPLTFKNIGEGCILSWSGNTADWSVVAKNVSFLNNDLEVGGNINLTTGYEFKVNGEPIPTNAEVALKAPIDNTSLTGNTQMTRLTVNHSDPASIGLDFNNTNTNQYAGAFNTAAYGWRFFNDNTGLAGNTTFSVNTKGSGATQTPLLVKNDGKLYTLDQEVDGNINLTTGHEFQINGVPLSSGGMTPEQEAELTSTTTKVDNLYNISPVTLQNVNFTNSVWNIGLNNVILHIQDAMAVGQVPQDRITNLPADIAAKRALTNNTFSQLNLNGTTQYMTASGGTINFSDYFTEFDLTGLVNTDLVVGIDETTILYQTKCIFIKTDDPSNTTGNLIIRSNKILTDQDIILRKKGDCVFLHADWNSSRWKVLGIFSNVQQSLHVTQSIVADMNILCKQNLFSNSAETTYIDGFSNINLRTPDSGGVPTISIDGQEAFMTKATNQTISGVKTFTNGIFSTQVSSKNDADLMLKTNDTDHKIDIANGANIGLSQTLTKTSLNRALNIPYASVPLGTGGSNKDPPTGSVSGDIYRDNANALHITP